MSPQLHHLRLLVASLAAIAIQFLPVAVAAAAACTGGGPWPGR